MLICLFRGSFEFRRNIAAVVNRWRHYVRIDEPGNRTPDLSPVSLQLASTFTSEFIIARNFQVCSWRCSCICARCDCGTLLARDDLRNIFIFFISVRPRVLLQFRGNHGDGVSRIGGKFYPINSFSPKLYVTKTAWGGIIKTL